MAKPPRVSRLPLFCIVALVATGCRCQYEVVRGGDDAGMDAQAMDGQVPDTGIDGSLPVAFVLQGNVSTTRTGDFDTGTAFDEKCPPGQVLRGYTGTHQEDGYFFLVTNLQGMCGRLELDPDGTTIHVVSDATLMNRGAVSDTPVSWACPADEAIVGIYGNAGTAQDGVGFYCAPLTLVGGVVTRGAVTTLPVYGGVMGTPYDHLCPTGGFAYGNLGTAQVYIHGFSLWCDVPTPAP